MTGQETARQRALLLAPVGAPGSGGVRYAAAMYFYARGSFSAEVLEIYRRCAKFDAEDPVDLARFEGLRLPPVLTQVSGDGG